MRKTFLASCAIGLGLWACVSGDDSAATGTDGGTATDAATGSDAASNDSGGGGTDAGSDSGSFSPTMLPGLALWLDAAKGVGGTTEVGSWADQSGKGNNASKSDGGGSPSLMASAFNGLPAIHFEPPAADAFEIQDNASLDVTGDFLIEAVFDFRNTAEYSSVVLKQAAPYPYAGPCIFVNYPTYSGDGGLYTTIDGQLTANYQYVDFVATATQGLNDGQGRLFGFRRVGTTIESRLNGAASITHPDAGLIDVSAVGRLTYIGSGTLKGDVAEVVVVNGTTSDADLAALEGYLKTKYGL